MTKQVTKRVSTIKLPGSQYTQTGRETLRELLRVNFPDSRLPDDSDNAQGQLNMGVCRSKMKKGECNMARKLINPKTDGY
jgi:hypothetical protein